VRWRGRAPGRCWSRRMTWILRCGRGGEALQRKRYTSHVTRHTPHATRHTPSHATRHTPDVTRHTSHVTRHMRARRKPAIQSCPTLKNVAVLRLRVRVSEVEEEAEVEVEVEVVEVKIDELSSRHHLDPSVFVAG